MTAYTMSFNAELLAYVRSYGTRENSYLKRLREETATQPMAVMQISPEQGQLMTLLVELTDSRKAIEIGTFTGYSAMCIANGLRPGGKLVALEISEEYAAIARRHWRAAGLSDRIELRLAPAAETLAEMVKTERGTYDFIFVDADKPRYRQYYEFALQLLRPGGLVALDNALMEGAIIDPTDNCLNVTSMRSFNEMLISDERVSVSMVPISDGLYLARKRHDQ